MAKKAKKDTNFVIKCPHCLEHDFKLEDVKPDDKLKYYTDTPFKFAKPITSQGMNSANKNTEEKHSQFENEQNKVVSPSFQIYLTDISYNGNGRASDLNNLINP
jgi:hypothetical protein